MKKININYTSDSKETNWFLFCLEKFNNLPNTFILHDMFIGEEFINLLKSEEINSVIELLDSDEKIINQKSLHRLSDSIYVSFIELEKNSDEYFITEVIFYYTQKSDLEQINELLDKLNNIKIEDDFFEEPKKSKLNIISVAPDRLFLQPIDLNLEDKVNLEEKYNGEVIKDIKKLKKKIKNSKKGISIFYGERGLGKTEMVKHLISELDKTSIFIPSNSLDLTINNPDFKNLINKENLLIIDDCEFFSNVQISKMNFVTNNILQLVDGIISDHLNLHIILIFNEESIDDIDENILDCNNLIEVIEFKELDKDMSNELSKTIGYNKKYKTNQRLVDVINGKSCDSKTKMGI
jgi:hypothetical protein